MVRPRVRVDAALHKNEKKKAYGQDPLTKAKA